MKSIVFIDNHNCENTAFWLTKAGSIAHKYHPNLIACVVGESVNVDMLKMMILNSKLERQLYTAERLNDVFKYNQRR